MKYKILILLTAAIGVSFTSIKKAELTTTTRQTSWVTTRVKSVSTKTKADVILNLSATQQTVEGFGSCFNELGWTSLSLLKPEDLKSVMKELFSPGIGANFTVCRMPIGANDFAINWYSLNETDGDFDMSHFSIDNDQKTLIPFIKMAKEYNPAIKIWASPWSPPSWMKTNKHYAAKAYPRAGEFDEITKSDSVRVFTFDLLKLCISPKYDNGLPKDREGKEGTDMFIQEDKYLKAYALYFSKFIDAYKSEGISIAAVMPQNEFNSPQIFPSCCWTAKSLSNFIGQYLGPAMKEKGIQIYFGTMERPKAALVDTIMDNRQSGQYISGVGFQWAGKDALPVIHKKHPDLRLIQSEQECGNGDNDWRNTLHSWELMKHYFNNGVSVYDYWNTSLLKGGISRWGWPQNSLVVVDAATKTFIYTPEYYLLKHVSHYVKQGAKKLKLSGTFADDVLAFVNPDKSVVVVVANQEPKDKTVSFSLNNERFSPVLKANSFNTLIIK